MKKVEGSGFFADFVVAVFSVFFLSSIRPLSFHFFSLKFENAVIVLVRLLCCALFSLVLGFFLSFSFSFFFFFFFFFSFFFFFFFFTLFHTLLKFAAGTRPHGRLAIRCTGNV